MSISSLEEIKCPCGEVFEAELLSAISVSDNPELKEALISGEINIVCCPACGEMFYAERFILYHDSGNELIAFVYPSSFEGQAAQCKQKMQSEFSSAIKNFEDKNKITYDPMLFFGIDDLTLMLRAEQELEDEENVLIYTAQKINLSFVKIPPSFARKLNMPKALPVLKGEKKFGESSLGALKMLIKHNPNLLHYVKLSEKLSKNKNLIEEINKKLQK
ncbi:MAG: CpXC domain-containing protein [Endomicrobia bacterium]|nr:CpXC domain-containing protein [Endomicrobiia bacterium]